MKFTGIYAITDDKLLPGQQLFDACEAALTNGVSVLQYRNKSSSSALRLHSARRLANLCASFEVPLIVNDDVELCLSAGAAGVHLGSEDGSVEAARSRLGPEAIIGVTCHASIDAAVKAQDEGADYVAFGRFFPSNSKPEASPAELDTLTRAREVLKIPIVAIGGINAENGASVLQAGADMLAVIHALFAEDDVAGQSKKLLNVIEQYKLLTSSKGSGLNEQ